MDKIDVSFIIATHSNSVNYVPTFPLFMNVDSRMQFCTFHTLNYPAFQSVVSFPNSPDFQYAMVLKELQIMQLSNIKVYNYSKGCQGSLDETVSDYILNEPIPQNNNELSQLIKKDSALKLSKQIENGEFVYVEDNAPEFANLELPQGITV